MIATPSAGPPETALATLGRELRAHAVEKTVERLQRGVAEAQVRGDDGRHAPDRRDRRTGVARSASIGTLSSPGRAPPSAPGRPVPTGRGEGQPNAPRRKASPSRARLS